MTLQKIAETLETSSTYEDIYKKEMQSKPWLEELLMLGYEMLCENTVSEESELIEYRDAATVLDKVVLNVVMIYDKYLAELERNLESATS